MKARFLSWVRPDRISLPMMSRQAVTVAPVSSTPTLASWTIKSKFQPRQHGIGARVALRLHAGGHQRAAPVAQVVLVHPLAQPRVGRAVGQDRKSTRLNSSH